MKSFTTGIVMWLGVMMILLPMVLAAETLDQQQTSGGNFFDFYYSANYDHKWVKQQFQPTMTSITRVDLNLRSNYPSSAACSGANTKVDIEIRDSSDNTVASASNVDLCPKFSNLGSFEWISFPVSQSQPLVAGDKYWIFLNYRGYQTGYSAFNWNKATSDVKPNLIYQLPGSISGTYDFTFKTYGTPVTCTAVWVCKDSTTKAYRNTDCSLTQATACGSGNVCDSGACLANTPNINLVGIKTMLVDGTAKTTFNSGEAIYYQANVKNTYKSGSYSVNYQVYKDTTKVKEYVFSDTINEGEEKFGTRNDVIPADWSGAYRYVATVTPCFGSNVCTKETTFNVNYIPAISMNMVDSWPSPTSLLPGEQLSMNMKVKNLGAAGDYYADFTILKGGTVMVGPLGNGYNNAQNEEKTITLLYNIPSSWSSGNYVLRSTVSKCASPNTCTQDKTFTLNQVCTPTTWYKDNDADSYGDITKTTSSCTQPTGYVSNSNDCDDNNALVNLKKACNSDLLGTQCGSYALCVAQCPTLPAETLCDGKDNDCNLATSDTACPTGQSCDLLQKKCVSLCTAGTKCKDASTKGNQDVFCAWSNLITAGANSFCDSALNDFNCNSGYKNCDNNWNNGCEIDINNDVNNCGSCGNKCAMGYSCVNQLCEEKVILAPNTWIFVQSPFFFQYIYPEMVKNKNVNQYFFINETEEKAEQMMEYFRNDPLNALSDMDTARSFVVMESTKFIYSTSNIVNLPVKYTVTMGSNTYIARYTNAYLDINLGQQLAKAGDDIKKFTPEVIVAGNKVPVIDLGISIIVGASQSDGDVLKFLFYSTSNLAYNLNPIVIGLNLVGLGKNILFGGFSILCDAINYETCKIPIASDVIVNPISGVIDYLTDVNVLKTTFEGKCGIINGKLIGCLNQMSDDFDFWTHPLAIYPEDIQSIISLDKVTFKFKVKNVFGDMFNNYPMSWTSNIYTRMAITAKVTGVESDDCEFPYKYIDLAPGETKDVSFEWKIPPGAKNKELTFVTSNVYDCRYTCCPPDASFCSCDPNTGEGALNTSTMCLLPGKKVCSTQPISAYIHYFSIQNQPPIINSVTCNAINSIGSPLCAKNTDVLAGDKLTFTVESHDSDSGSLDIKFAGDYPASRIIRTCQDKNDALLGKTCTFAFQSLPEDIGKNYWINFIADDSLNQTIETYYFKVIDNSPKIFNPVVGAVIQTPTIEWTTIASVPPVKYKINLYQDSESTLTYTKTINDPNPSSANKKYVWSDALIKSKSYWIEVIGINNYGIGLKSSKVKFYTGCSTDLQCGSPLSQGLSCGTDGNVYETISTPKCINPNTLQSLCQNTLTKSVKSSCTYGCTNGICNKTPIVLLPDLTPSAFKIAKKTLLKGGCIISLEAPIKNIGNAPASKVGWSLTANGLPLTSGSIATIKVGQEVKAYPSIYLTKGTMAIISVDPNSKIKESNELNNRWRAIISCASTTVVSTRLVG
ncbi:MAG: CARDB domain-containing protein [Nanoarchaeota archaeon]